MSSEYQMGTLVNEAKACAEIKSIEDESERRMVELAYAAAATEYLRKPNQSDASWAATAPVEDFDLLFFVRVSRRLYRSQRTLECS